MNKNEYLNLTTKHENLSAISKELQSSTGNLTFVKVYMNVYFKRIIYAILYTWHDIRMYGHISVLKDMQQIISPIYFEGGGGVDNMDK